MQSLDEYGPVIRGTVLIDVGEGEFNGGIRIPLTRATAQDDFIRIVGKESNGIPTTRIVHSQGINRGLLAEDGLAVWLENLKFVGGFPVAVQFTRNVYGWFTNVHADGLGEGARGFSISAHSRYYIKGGLIENMTYAGIDEYFAVSRSLATVSRHTDQMIIRNCKIGLRSKEGCVGHLDYLEVEDCETGIELLQHCVANFKKVALRRNGTALAIINSASHNESGIVWGTGADANTREVYSAGASGELRAMMWAGESMGASASTGHRALFNIGNDYEQGTISCSENEEVLVAQFRNSLPKAYFRSVGKHFFLSMLVTVIGATTSEPVTLIARVDNALLGSIEVTTSGTQRIEFDTVCIRDRTQHLTSGTVSGAGNTSTKVSVSSDVLSGHPSDVSTVDVYFQSSATEQKIVKHSCELFG